ncbi:MAG: NADH-quinone oxidoreductase subunit F [Candidatus Zixiibacteriota bacterium]|nr:MAG: NADH-quinone oxidoreductase subunit F [candidate division Zixibacteria bacterium]
MKRLQSPDELLQLQQKYKKNRDERKTTISVCAGTGCIACGCEKVITALKEKIKKEKLDKVVEIKTTGCHGFCERGPLVVIQPDGIFYQKVNEKNIAMIVEKTIMNGQLVKNLLYRDPTTKVVIEKEKDIPFYKNQKRIIFNKNGLMDPTSIDDYITLGGYKALAKSLTELKPDEILEEVKKSGLRGRGGGGFPTGRKWETCKKAKNDTKYIICNADEGDPGAFMDRSILEGNPHQVIEGMIIGAITIGSDQGFVYVRHEYPLAVKNLSIALKAAREMGLLGENILGSGFNFDIEISRGGGAFVCGESTALMASLEGKVGEPRAKYIHTVEFGLWDKPTILNNVETWANVPVIIDKGSDWYSSIGTEKSKGTKVFALTGKINNTGLVEVPMGITLREILYDIGGGVPGGKKFKAVQTGGPSGGTLVVETADKDVHQSLVEHGDIQDDENIKSLLDLPVDFDELIKAGSMMGSGGMIVMDQDSCMVDVAKYFLNFLMEESCGKCIPCREGVKTMWHILDRITKGEGKMEDLESLEDLSQVIIDTSLCQLGGSAPNPVLSTLRYFHNEYLAHIEDKRCPAGVCKELVAHAIDETCNGCHACVKPCPTDAIIGKPKELHRIDQDKCIQCGACYQVCKFDAIKRVRTDEGDAVQVKAKQLWQSHSPKKTEVVM